MSLVNKRAKGSLVGQDGNAFYLMGYFSRQARKSGWSQKEIDLVLAEAKADDYNHLLCTLDSYLEPEDEEDFLEGEV